MTKEYKYVNLSQRHELEYHLKKNDKKTTNDNVEFLKSELELEKLLLDKTTLSHDDVDNVIINSFLLEPK